LIIHQSVGELGAARRASVAVFDAIHFPLSSSRLSPAVYSHAIAP
jgi:hypothetical protein